MKTTFLLSLVVILIDVVPGQAVRADIAPPTGLIVAVSLGAVIGLGILVSGVVLVSVLVIRAIKKKTTPKDDA